jgi:uncharacterized protein (TIRG00374 family)
VPLTRRTALLSLGIVVTVFFSYLAVRNAHLSEVRDALRESNLLWLLPASSVLAVAVWLRAVRWWSLFPRETRPPLLPVTRALLIGYFFNSVLPLRAGEAARIVALNRDAGTSMAVTTGTAVIERVYDVLGLLLLLFVLLPWLPDVTWLRAAAAFGAAVSLGAVVAVVVLIRFGHRPLHFVLRPLARLPGVDAARVERGALNLERGFAGLRHADIALPAAFWTLLSWVVVGVSAWLVTLGFDLGVSLSPLAGLFVIITINLALVLPSSPAAVGVFEAATLLALDAYGVSESRALSYAVVLHALNFLPFVAVGVLLVRRARVR